jgi:hypothetical protein
MKINANICISRDSSDTMRLKVRDEASRVTFLELQISPHDLMMALTGLGYVDAKTAEVRGLDVVGKEKITETRSTEYPGVSYESREKMEAWLCENCQEPGWIINPYLRSQSSISSNGDTTILRYSVSRFVDKAEADQGGAA